MNRHGIYGDLLKSVSRSFYLTIRVLPENLGQPIGLAYLLARASDSIADTSNARVEVRLKHLQTILRNLPKLDAESLADLQCSISPPDMAECRLIARIGACFIRYRRLSPFDREAVGTVLEKIIHGQTLDVQRFQDASRVVALQTAAELEEYTYLVAGCVGEFWTRVCCHHVPDYAKLPEAELMTLGRSYGQGLQLINILRDLPADRRSGRCYLPEDELRAAGSTPEAPARAVFDRWHARAFEQLDDGRRYIRALRPARLRVACFLPWYLGVATLRLMQKRCPLETDAKVKVSRAVVRKALFLAPLAAFTNLPLAAPVRA